MSERSSTDPITPGYDQAQLDWLNSKLVCDQCQSTFDHWYARDNWESERPDHRHHTLHDLQESARRCPICELWMVGLREDDSFPQSHHEVVSEADQRERGLVMVRYVPIAGSYECTLIFSSTTPTSPMLSSYIDLYDSPLEGDESMIIGAVNGYTDCEASWKLARGWLKSCTESHPSCGEQIMELKPPRRLINVGREEGQARLCLGTDLPADIQYLTLSHCWGQKKFTTLLRENMETFCSGIPNSMLSKTFKDAAKATQELGFRYIWIDSLCIVQDDYEDWNEHATLMGSIYSNSVLNLSAIDSVDGDGGCFFRREAQKVYCWKLHLKDEQGPMDSQVSKLWLCCPEEFVVKHWGGNVLSARAWVCQERCLAPRSLSFGQRELIWQCREHRASETLPNGFSDGTVTIPGILSGLREQLSVQRLLGVWGSIVSDYSKGKLTYWSDKLVAISGIARLVTQKRDMDYLAGLWREHLVRQLVWGTDLTSVSPTDQYQAPSWSWAAINSQVFNFSRLLGDDGTCVELAVVEEACVTSMGNPFDEVSGGALTLRCPYFGIGSTIRIVRGFRIKWGSGHIPISRVHPDHEPHRFYGQLFYLPIVFTRQENDKGHERLHGLVLKLSTLEKYV